MKARALAISMSLATAALFAGCHKGAPQGPVLTKEQKLLADLAVFTAGKPPSLDEIKKVEKEPVDKYIDDLLRRPMGHLAKDVVLGGATGVKDRHPVPSSMALRSFKDGDEKIYYLREKCAAADAVKVKPWWDGNKEVKICPSSYRPDVTGDAKGNTCGAEMLEPRSADVCGCGPMLMFCTESRDHYKQMQDRLSAEVIDTAAYVVDNDMPIESLFTMNETVRNADAEAVYRRARALAGEDITKLFPVTDMSDGRGRLTPRTEQVPGQMAGILTTPSMTYSSDALRGVMRNYYDYLWCTGLQSSRVTTQAILGLDTVDLRVGDGWKKLAAMNICTDCHARLDYGMQFFHGYPNSTQGVDFRPSMVTKGPGTFYANNIKDPRGEGELVPATFGKLITAQPEFGECMTRRVVDHVFNGTDNHKDFDAVLETFKSSHKIKEMLRTAMLRYAKRDAKDRPAPDADKKDDDASEPVHVAAGGDGKIALSPKLQKMIKRDCKECHDKDDEFNLLQPELDRREVAMMIDKVGFGAMPKDQEGLEDKERRAFVAELSKALFKDKDAEQAQAYFADGFQGDPIHRYYSAMNSVNASAVAGMKKEDLKDFKQFRAQGIESAVPQSQMSYTPGIALAAGVTALKACKSAGLVKDKLAACVERASAPDNVVAGPVLR